MGTPSHLKDIPIQRGFWKGESVFNLCSVMHIVNWSPGLRKVMTWRGEWTQWKQGLGKEETAEEYNVIESFLQISYFLQGNWSWFSGDQL